MGAKLLFIHSCAVFARDARVRLRALASWRAIGGADAKRATSLARNALLYRFVADLAPRMDTERRFSSKWSSWRVWRRNAWARSATRAKTRRSHRPSITARRTTARRRRSDVDRRRAAPPLARSAAFAPTVAGAEDCGVLEVSSAARDVLELIVALLDACEDVEGASRRHDKIRVQMEDASAGRGSTRGGASA